MERFINQKVTIIKDGEQGKVISISKEDRTITIQTPKRERMFSLDTVVNEKIVFNDKKLQEAAIKAFEEYINELDKEQAKFEEAEAIRRENEEIARVRRDIGNSNVAFKCTYCNGGASSTSLGFKGACSPEIRAFNTNHREWCSGDICRCKKLEEGELSQEEFDASNVTSDKFAFLCYESRMLIDWICYAGMEKKTGKPMALNNAQTGSLAVLTTRPVIDGKEVPQEETQIFAVFLIAKHNDLSDIGGSATAHPKYRLELTPEESKQMLLWKYHSNTKNKDKAMWGTGLHRYLSDMVCCQILKDIVNVVKDPSRHALAVELLEKFQQETGIMEIDEPNGAI